jgi:hypothetical protein
MCLPSGALTPWLQISKRVPETPPLTRTRAGFSFWRMTPAESGQWLINGNGARSPTKTLS